MRKNDWLIGFSALVLIVLTSCAQPARIDNPIPVSNTNPSRDWVQDLDIALHATIDFFDAIGDLVIQLGRVSRSVLGFLTCLVLPFACLGVWALRNLPRILGLMTLRDNVRSFFRD